MVKKILDKWKKFATIEPMKKELIIIRGCPSSGKSFIANELIGETGQAFSADDYHIDPITGKYNWKPENVRNAHQWNHKRIEKAIKEGVSPIIIDNTHVSKWELISLKPLIQKAQQSGYNVRIEEPNPNWYHWDTAFDANALFERNKKTHNVPKETIERMISNWEKDVTIEDILKDEKS